MILDNTLESSEAFFLDICVECVEVLKVRSYKSLASDTTFEVSQLNEKLRRKGKGFQTTKRNKYGHGIGLKNVGQIVEAYGGHMEIEHTDEMFSVEMLLFI